MAKGVSLQNSYSKLNEALIHQFDSAGVRRSFTVPYINQPMKDHIAAVGQAAQQAGGLSQNLIMSAHHSEGKGWGGTEGHTTGHSADKLRSTVIPKNSETAKASIQAAQTHLNNIKGLLGEDDPSVQTAQDQLNLVKKTDGAGMSLLDFGVFLVQIMLGPNQAVARAHSGTKSGGHAPQLRAPSTAGSQGSQEPQEQPAGEAKVGSQAPEAQSVASTAQTAPVASPAGAPASPQA